MVCFPRGGPGVRPPLSSALPPGGGAGGRGVGFRGRGSSWAPAMPQPQAAWPMTHGPQTAFLTLAGLALLPAGRACRLLALGFLSSWALSPCGLEASEIPLLKGPALESWDVLCFPQESLLCLPRGEKLPATLAKSHPGFLSPLTTHLLLGICLWIAGRGGQGEPQHFPYPSIPTLRRPPGQGTPAPKLWCAHWQPNIGHRGQQGLAPVPGSSQEPQTLAGSRVSPSSALSSTRGPPPPFPRHFLSRVPVCR